MSGAMGTITAAHSAGQPTLDFHQAGRFQSRDISVAFGQSPRYLGFSDLQRANNRTVSNKSAGAVYFGLTIEQTILGLSDASLQVFKDILRTLAMKILRGTTGEKCARRLIGCRHLVWISR